MQKALACFLLHCLEQLRKTVLHIVLLLETLAEVTDDQSSKCDCLQGVLYFHIDHMHRLPGLLFSSTQIFHHRFIYYLSTSEDDINGISALLKSFRARFDSLISFQDL